MRQYNGHCTVGPGTPRVTASPVSRNFKRSCIHAEVATGSGLPEPIQLFVRVPDSHTQTFFADGQRVVVYLYPPGTLHGQLTPTATPRAYEGRVTMTNEVRNAPVDAREATCRIVDLNRPVIEPLPAPTVPAPSGEFSQVVIRLDDQGPTELPIFHSAQQEPKIKLGIESVPARNPDNRRPVHCGRSRLHSSSSI